MSSLTSNIETVSQDQHIAPVPIDTTTEAFAKFAKNEPSTATHFVVRVTTDTTGQEIPIFDAAHITYDPTAKKANIVGILPQSGVARKVTYEFKSDDKLYAVYRVKNIKIPNQVKAFIADPSILTAKDVDLAFGADIISDFVKYIEISKAVECNSGFPCAVVQIGKSLDIRHRKADFDDVKIYFGKVSMTVCGSFVAVAVKNGYETVTIPCTDVTSIYAFDNRDANIPILPMEERVEQFNKCGSTGVNNVYGILIVQIMRNVEAQHTSDQIKKTNLVNSINAKLANCSIVDMADLFKDSPDITKYFKSWTIAHQDGKFTFTAN